MPPIETYNAAIRPEDLQSAVEKALESVNVLERNFSEDDQTTQNTKIYLIGTSPEVAEAVILFEHVHLEDDSSKDRDWKHIDHKLVGSSGLINSVNRELGLPVKSTGEPGTEEDLWNIIDPNDL